MARDVAAVITALAVSIAVATMATGASIARDPRVPALHHQVKGPQTQSSGIAFVKEVVSATRQSYSLSNRLTLPVPASGVSGGDTVIITAECSTLGVTATAATDSRGNTYTVDAAVANSGTSTATNVLSAYVKTPLVGSDVITITFSSPAAILSALVTEWSGIAPSERVDRTAVAQGWTVNLSSSAAAPTRVASELLVGSFASSTNTTFNPGSGFTAFSTQMDPSLGSTWMMR